MAGIVNFFKQKKVDAKFSRAGEGHRLNEEKKPVVQPQPKVVPDRKPQSSAAMMAGVTALERQQSSGSSDNKPVRPKLGTSIKSTANKSLLSEAAGHDLSTKKSYSPQPSHSSNDGTPSTEEPVPAVVTSPFSVKVLMVCPICSQCIVYANINDHIKQCLQEEYLKEPVTISARMIHMLAESEEMRVTCINTLVKYLDNIVSHPEDEKYRKIRASNKAFKERVECVMGGVMFLEAIGFTQQLLPHEDKEQQFYVLPESKIGDIPSWKEVLTSVEKLVPELSRNPQLLVPTGNIEHFDLSNEFYHLSLDEIRREQRLRTEAVEQASVLRTKAMRERDEIKSATKYYRFILLRIRFPEDVILQGVFRPMEPLSAVRQFISGDCLLDPSRQYKLSFMRNQLTDDTSRLAQLGLAPAAVLSLQWEGDEELAGFPIEQIFKPNVFATL